MRRAAAFTLAPHTNSEGPMRTLSKLVVTVAAALAASSAQAQVHSHEGLFVRLDAGIGYKAMNEPTGTSAGDLKIDGAAGTFGVAVGGAVAENLILAGHLYASSASNPSVSLSNGGSTGTTDTTASMVGLGPQLTYYFMPVNVYVSGTLALTKLSLKVNGTSGDSNTGVGALLAVGKEWWVSDKWGLGAAGQFRWSSNSDQGTNAPTISTWGLGVAFSATYN
jgi:hypothetical protein